MTDNESRGNQLDMMTLRDWFAANMPGVRLEKEIEWRFAEALIGKAPNVIKEPEAYLNWFNRYAATIRYAQADAMLEVREQDQKEHNDDRTD